MDSIWRKHLIICLILGLLPVPIYFLGLVFNRRSGSGDWIKLDFRAFILWTYITWLAIHVALSSMAVLSFPKLGASRIHLVSMLLSLFLVVCGIVMYSKLRHWAVSKQYRTLMESRRHRSNVIDLKKWWYVPNEIDPTEIRVSVVVGESGRFAGNVTGQQTDLSGSPIRVFESIYQPRRQRQVGSGEAFTYIFPLEVLQAAHANDVRITLYLFKAPSGPAAGDITKVFMNSPKEVDDGEYFYGVLPPPSRPVDR